MRKLKLSALFAAMLFATSMWAANPIGCVDAWQGYDGSIYIKGWAFDSENTNAALAIHVYMYKAGVGDAVWSEGNTVANAYRPDVNNVHHCGNNHGFERCISTANVAPGTYWINIWALHAAGTSGTNVRLQQAGTSDQYDFTITVKSPLTISYNANGGSGAPSSQQKCYGININLQGKGSLARTGYTPDGWATSSTGGKAYDFGASYSGNSSTTLYAHWNVVNYTIGYTLNGGSVTGNPTSYNITTNTFTLKNPTRTGYTFKGWTGSNGNTPQTSVSIAKGSTGNKTYTANWTPVKYTIAYNLDGGEATNPTEYTVETATFTLNNPTKEHNDFLGWTGSNGSTPQTTVTINNGSTGDKTYTANWLLHTFAVETDESMASDWSVTASPVGVGQTVTATYSGTKHVKSVSYLGVPVVTAPTAKSGLIYTGSAQELVNAGTTTGGTMQYKVNEGEWSDAVPSATNAGTYTVYYRVQADETYAGNAGGSFNVTIAKATPAAVTLSKTSISFGADDFTTTFTVTRTGDGAISVSSSNSEVKCTVSGNTVTVRRRSGRSLSDVTITVSVAASANYLAPANKTCSYSHSALRTPANIQAKDKGCFLGAYGYLWPKNYATDIVEPLRAVVAYVGSCDKYFDKCLCIALEDISNTRLSRADAATAVSTWASSHSVNVGGTVYSSDAGGYYDFAGPSNYKIRDWAVAKGWRLPTVCDWRYIMNAYKSSSLTNPAGVNHGVNPNLCKWSELRTEINNATGGTAMKTDNNYGSSTRDDGNSNIGTWHVGSGDGGSATWWWANDHDGYKYYYRAVFAY